MPFLTSIESRPFIFVFTALSLFISVSAFEQCYYPDGSIPKDYVWEPCTGSQYSSCCVPSEGDICQPDGLCYYPLSGAVYRGTCTDRTWNSPACPADTCLTGFETTWTWALECDDPSGSKSVVCGPVDSTGRHSTPTCAANAATNTKSFVTTRSTTTAGRYTAPPSLDSKIFSVWTSSYTTIITANVQTTTLTSTFASTFTSSIAKSGATTTNGVGASSAPSSTSSSAASSDGATAKTGVTLSTGVLVAIIVGAVVVTALLLGLFLCLRKKRSPKKSEAIRLNSTEHLPQNGPVGADQVHPYEAPLNESSALPRKYVYAAPKNDAYEIGDRTSIMREKKAATAMEMGTDDYESLRSPAPTYTEAPIPVEMDATPVYRSPNTVYGRF